MPTRPLTDDQLRRTLDALAEAGGDTTAAAAALGLHRNTLYSRLRSAALRGLDGSVPRALPAGQLIKGISTLYDRNGQISATWVKTATDGEADRASWLEAVREALEGYSGAAEAVPAPDAFDRDMLTLLALPDLHFGMYAWQAETGEAYDLDIADRLLAQTSAEIMSQTPPSAEAVVLFLGDTTHADNNQARTPRSGNALDVDTRHQKVMLAAARAAIRVVDLARRKHGRVTVRVLPGNHDPETAGALAIALALYFEGEDRVIVDLDPGLFWFMEWGNNLLGATHGDNIKMDDMPGAMAARCAPAWGRTIWRRFYSAHIHHRTGIEKHGVLVQSLRTIAAKDAYHSGHGYTSDRVLSAFRFHKERGPRGSIEVAIPVGAVNLGRSA